jgi:NMD protein affecting ribosome stability and mRNA decay
MTASVCRQCSADTHPTRVGRVEGEDSGIRVALEGLTTVECTNSHTRFPTPDYPLELIQALLKKAEIVTAPFAVEKGLFRKRMYCPECAKELPGESTSTATTRTEVGLPDQQPVSVELAVPLYRCPGCSREVTLPEKNMAKDIMQAVANAFRSADIPPG